MAKEIQILAWCDGLHEDPAPGDYTHTISLDGGKPIEVDLCTSCENDVFISVLLNLLDNGAEVEEHKIKPRPKIFDCPIEGCDFSSPTGQGRGRHLRAAHDTSMEAVGQ